MSLSFLKIMLGPIVVIALLALQLNRWSQRRPTLITSSRWFSDDCCNGVMRKAVEFTEFRLSKVIGVSILLIIAGTIAGIIKLPHCQVDMIALLEAMNMPAFVLAHSLVF